MTVECGGVRGQPFFESICGWSGRLQWRFMCALLCSIWNNLDSTVFNQQRKMKRKKTENRERKTGNWNENWKRKTVHRYICVFVLDRRQTTVGVGVASDTRWMMIYMYILYLGCFQLAYGREEKERERARTTKLSPWRQGEGGRGGLGAYWGKLLSVFVMRSLTDFVAQELWEKSIRKAKSPEKRNIQTEEDATTIRNKDERWLSRRSKLINQQQKI